jgi:hypothetical protein
MASWERGSGRSRLVFLSLLVVLALFSTTLLVTPAASGGDGSGEAGVAKKGKKRKKRKKRKITGKLSERGYTVIALSKKGKTKVDRAPKGKFKLRPPAKRVSLSLRAPNGKYAGPIVLKTRKKGRVAIVGVSAGARLGHIEVDEERGYAKVRRLRKRKWLASKRKARAKNGVPIGAGRFGRVRSKRTKGGAPGDRDLDGVADQLDIDDDGDLVIDELDRKPRKASKSGGPAGASAVGQTEFGITAFTGEGGAINRTANVNAAGITEQDIEDIFLDALLLEVGILPGDSSELDCGQPQGSANPGLSYCTEGGTGERGPDEDTPPGIPFPECCDNDGDGYGKLIPDNPGGGSPMGIKPLATPDQIGSGDVMIQRVTTDGHETPFVGTIQYVFVTAPALVSYSDGQGNSATIDYPVGPGGPGTGSNPFPVEAGPGGDVNVNLTFWRPQRLSIPPEPGTWTDMGGLYQSVHIPYDGGSCYKSAFSNPDPELRLVTGETVQKWRGIAAGFRDQAPDRPASPDNTFSYRLNLTDCLQNHGDPGNPSTNLTFNVGETRDFTFASEIPPDDSSDTASTGVAFQRVG